MSSCSQCGATFSCGMVDTTTTEACWCTALPTAPKGELARDADGRIKTCMCPDCLSDTRVRRLATASSALKP